MEHPTLNGRHSGFTYIGLLIGVAIMGAVLAAVGPVWHTLVQREHEKDLLFIGNQFRSALNRYYSSNQRFPMRLEDLIQDDGKLAVKRHLRKIFFDPMTGQAEWGIVKLPNGQIAGVYSLSEEQPLKIAGFRQRDVSFEGKTKYSEWVFSSELAAIPGTAPNTLQPIRPIPNAQSPAKF